MRVSSTLLAGLGLALAALTSQAQVTPTVQPAAPAAPAASYAPARSYPKSSIGLSLGWNAPYALGVDYSYLLTPNLDVNAGMGIGVGTKIGIGTRYYFAPARKVSPFIGANLVHSGGIDNMELTIEEANVGSETVSGISFQPTSLLHLRGGIRWQPAFRFGFIGALGYAARLSGNPVRYSPGNEPQRQFSRDVIDLTAPGGVEISLGIAIGLGPEF